MFIESNSLFLSPSISSVDNLVNDLEFAIVPSTKRLFGLITKGKEPTLVNFSSPNPPQYAYPYSSFWDVGARLGIDGHLHRRFIRPLPPGSQFDVLDAHKTIGPAYTVVLLLRPVFVPASELSSNPVPHVTLTFPGNLKLLISSSPSRYQVIIGSDANIVNLVQIPGWQWVVITYNNTTVNIETYSYEDDTFYRLYTHTLSSPLYTLANPSFSCQYTPLISSPSYPEHDDSLIGAVLFFKRPLLYSDQRPYLRLFNLYRRGDRLPFVDSTGANYLYFNFPPVILDVSFDAGSSLNSVAVFEFPVGLFFESAAQFDPFFVYSDPAANAILVSFNNDLSMVQVSNVPVIILASYNYEAVPNQNASVFAICNGIYSHDISPNIGAGGTRVSGSYSVRNSVNSLVYATPIYAATFSVETSAHGATDLIISAGALWYNELTPQMPSVYIENRVLSCAPDFSFTITIGVNYAYSWLQSSNSSRSIDDPSIIKVFPWSS